MKIIQACPNEGDRMYCPSNDEIIFAPGYESLNYDAKAFIAIWEEGLTPYITNEELKASWEKYYNTWDEESKNGPPLEMVEKFLQDYENDLWIVYKCEIYAGFRFFVYFVVKSDTIIEIDPDPYEDIDVEEEEK